MFQTSTHNTCVLHPAVTNTERAYATMISGRKNRRNTDGNMMLLSVLGFGLLILFITIGTSFSMVLFVQNQVQRLADQVALTGACQLNDGNRLGQMNNLVARCRQLVYASRQNTYLAANSSSDLQ